jgi:AcrR family transcriptional regulator
VWLGSTTNLNRTERKKERTKNKIIDVAVQLFANQGVNETTMEQIAEEADIAKGTLYNYFSVKEAIINAYIQRSFRTQNADRILQLQHFPDTKSRMVVMINKLIAGIQEQRDLFEKYLVYRIQTMISFHPREEEKSGMKELADAIIQMGKDAKEIRDDIPHHVIQDLFEFIFIEVVKQVYMEPLTFRAEEAIEKYVDLFMNGVRPESVQ